MRTLGDHGRRLARREALAARPRTLAGLVRGAQAKRIRAELAQLAHLDRGQVARVDVCERFLFLLFLIILFFFFVLFLLLNCVLLLFVLLLCGGGVVLQKTSTAFLLLLFRLVALLLECAFFLPTISLSLDRSGLMRRGTLDQFHFQMIDNRRLATAANDIGRSVARRGRRRR